MFWQVTLSLLEGFGMTLTIFALTLLFAIPLGLVIAFGSMSKLGFVIRRFGKTSDGMMKPIPIYPIALVCKFLVWVIRGTPLMLQLIVIYYGPGLLGGQLLPRTSGRGDGMYHPHLPSFPPQRPMPAGKLPLPPVILALRESFPPPGVYFFLPPWENKATKSSCTSPKEDPPWKK